MKITDDQKPKYSAFMQDLWGLIKQYRNPEESLEYWDSLRDTVTAISNKHGNDVLVMKLLVAFVDAVDKEYGGKEIQ